MKARSYIVVLFLLVISFSGKSQSLLNKLKRQTEDKLIEKTVDAVFGEDGNSGTTNNPSSPNTSGTTNTKGSGLIIEPPDVVKNIGEAETAFGTKNYSSAKYALRQAMVGIEMEIGESILKSLPTSVDGLQMDPDADKVTSMSYGFVGLTMERQYTGKDKELQITIGNNSALLGAVNMMISGGAYASSSAGQNYKQTTFKGYRSIIQYDESSGYTLSVPFGQSSIMVVNGINYESEPAIMSAAENFDVEKIKSQLGEK
ncbi:MAG: hypothetical protein U5K79_21370 [Cyclobacteriaceae bacterium]|nr:hypothetical protein [Cyclobacteriaceae bacterium]